ncbi:hypothetical protein CR513_47470, partial [Mucuna pruriens]
MICTYFTSQGIIHDSSYANTPQQNGVAERKNELYYFKETCPNPTREKLTSNGLIPRIFGCTIQPLSMFTNSIECIFLSCSPTQKGYKCYNPSSKNWYKKRYKSGHKEASLSMISFRVVNSGRSGCYRGGVGQSGGDARWPTRSSAVLCHGRDPGAVAATPVALQKKVKNALVFKTLVRRLVFSGNASSPVTCLLRQLVFFSDLSSPTICLLRPLVFSGSQNLLLFNHGIWFPTNQPMTWNLERMKKIVVIRWSGAVAGRDITCVVAQFNVAAIAAAIVAERSGRYSGKSRRSGRYCPHEGEKSKMPSCLNCLVFSDDLLRRRTVVLLL